MPLGKFLTEESDCLEGGHLYSGYELGAHNTFAERTRSVSAPRLHRGGSFAICRSVRESTELRVQQWSSLDASMV
jgi:hypothetical protein